MAAPSSPDNLDVSRHGEPFQYLLGKSSSESLDYQKVGEPYPGVASGPPAITGTVASSVSTPVIASTASETFDGTAALIVPSPSITATATETFSATTALTVPQPSITAAVVETFAGTAALTVPEPGIASTAAEAFSATTALAVPEPTIVAIAALSFDATAALDAAEPSIAAVVAANASVTPVSEVVQPGQGNRTRRRLTRFRRELEPRFVSATLHAPQPRLHVRAHQQSVPRQITAWLSPRGSVLHFNAHVLNLRHATVQLSMPLPTLRSCRQLAAPGCMRFVLRRARPTLKASLAHTPDETWLMASLISEGRNSMRAEATKRLSQLQRELTAHVAHTDHQQHRLVSAVLPHIRHAFTAQRDAILVALPHAAKAYVDPEYVLNDQGFLNAVALLIQALQDLQETGVTLGYTDSAPPSDMFNLDNPYVQAAIDQLATRISGITETTAQDIRDVIAQGLAEGWSVADMGSAIQDLGAFSEARALTISLTESRVALNNGNAAAWQDMGVEEVLIADGDYDEVCAELDGSTQTLAWYMANPISHPRCRRTATAIPVGVPA